MARKTTKTATKKTSKKAPKAKKAETIYRVVPLPLECRVRLRANRAKFGSNQAVIEHSLYRVLPHIIHTLEGAGFDKLAHNAGKTKKYRLPLGTQADIDELNKAAEHVGLPATLLLKLALWSLD